MPILSHRREPLTSVPPTATAISRATASRYKGSATRASRCGAMLATAHIRTSAKPSASAWLVSRAMLWSDADTKRDHARPRRSPAPRPSGSCRPGAQSVARACRAMPRASPSVGLVFRLAGRFGPDAAGSSARLLAEQVVVEHDPARSAPPPARRIHRFRPAPPARSWVCRPARRPRTTHDRASARRRAPSSARPSANRPARCRSCPRIRTWRRRTPPRWCLRAARRPAPS